VFTRIINHYYSIIIIANSSICGSDCIASYCLDFSLMFVLMFVCFLIFKVLLSFYIIYLYSQARFT